MAEKKVQIINDPHAPDFFASWHHGLAARHGNIHVTFVADRPDHSGDGLTFVVNGRLIMPMVAARDLAEKLLEFLDKLDKQPPAPIGPPPSSTLQ